MSLIHTRLVGRDTVAEGTVAFHFEKPAGFVFEPGQAIDLVLEAPGLADVDSRHAFTLACAPHEERLSITTRLRGSAFKRTLDALPVGATVGIDGPWGELVLDADTSRPSCLVAGGIGITPFISIVRDAAHRESTRQLLLVYSNRHPHDAAFLNELEIIAHQHPNIRLVATMTQMDRRDGWLGETARLDAAFLQRVLEGYASPIAYVAGPPAMVAAVTSALVDAGVPRDDVRAEMFDGY